MYPRTKFQSIWRTSDFETKFTPVPNFSQFEESQITGQPRTLVFGTRFAQKTL